MSIAATTSVTKLRKAPATKPKAVAKKSPAKAAAAAHPPFAEIIRVRPAYIPRSIEGH